jgi:hypothetical protein
MNCLHMQLSRVYCKIKRNLNAGRRNWWDSDRPTVQTICRQAAPYTTVRADLMAKLYVCVGLNLTSAGKEDGRAQESSLGAPTDRYVDAENRKMNV